MDESLCYSVENVRLQTQDAEAELGCYTVRFYVDGDRPSRVPTGTVEEFFYYPSGGTIRDRDLNIVCYEPRLDTYHTSNRDA
ncbi:MAG: hypothetical protein KFF77_02400 [Bacteroidetes bacterium]|nr:hypothetical protein [Bacteroidota bacterium]